MKYLILANTQTEDGTHVNDIYLGYSESMTQFEAIDHGHKLYNEKLEEEMGNSVLSMQSDYEVYLLEIGDMFSMEEMLSFGNFIRDNFFGIGAPKMQPYNIKKHKTATVEDIFGYWLDEVFFSE